MDNATISIAVGLRLGAQIVCHTNVYTELRSQSMVIRNYLFATAHDDNNATIKSTRYCVMHLTLLVHMQLASHTRSTVVMTRDKMEQLKIPSSMSSVGSAFVFSVFCYQ